MTYRPDRHRRHSIRLRGYDYSRAGAYFVTLCTKNRACLFGDVVDGVMRLNDVGQIVRTLWDGLPSLYPGVHIDEFVVMPNHVHGIIVLTEPGVGAPFMAPEEGATCDDTVPVEEGAMNRAPTADCETEGRRGGVNRPTTFGDAVFVGAPFMAPSSGAMNRAPTLGNIVRGFKARVTAARNAIRQSPGVPVWQRNYYEHIIRNDDSLQRIRQYIIDNPAQWASDRENPSDSMSEPRPTVHDEPWQR